MRFFLSRIAQLAGAHAINSVAAGIAVALFAGVFLWAISCRNSRTRFSVLFAALLAIAGLSFLTFVPLEAPGVAMNTPRFTLPISWAEYALVGWAVFAAVGLLRIVVGLVKVLWLKRHCEPMPDALISPQLRQILDGSTSIRRVTLCISDTLRVPAAVGFFRPAVVVPRWVIDELSPAELNAVVLHELGHLRRWDDWTNLAQRIVRSVLFFHPAVWWLDSRLTIEREMACDDLVLAHGGDARGYAECLVSVAEKSAINSRLALALAAVTRMQQTALRLKRILDPARRVDTRISRFAVSTVALVGGFAFVALPHTPALIAFQTSGDTAQHAQIENTLATRPGMVIPASYNSAASPQVVPTMLRYSEQVNNGNRRLELKKVPVSKIKRAVPAQVRSVSPILTRAALRDGDSLVVPTLLVVVQTNEYNNNFSSVWTLCVWRVTTVPDNSDLKRPTQIQNGTVRKSI